jgi:hypothetical protein
MPRPGPRTPRGPRPAGGPPGGQVKQPGQVVAPGHGRFGQQPFLGLQIVDAAPAADPIAHYPDGRQRRYGRGDRGRGRCVGGRDRRQSEVKQGGVDLIGPRPHPFKQLLAALAERISVVSLVAPTTPEQLPLEEAGVDPDPMAGRAHEEDPLQPLGGKGKLVVDEVQSSEMKGGCGVGRVAGDGPVEEPDGLSGRRSRVDGESEVGLGQRL